MFNLPSAIRPHLPMVINGIAKRSIKKLDSVAFFFSRLISFACLLTLTPAAETSEVKNMNTTILARLKFIESNIFEIAYKEKKKAAI